MVGERCFKLLKIVTIKMLGQYLLIVTYTLMCFLLLFVLLDLCFFLVYSQVYYSLI